MGQVQISDGTLISCEEIEGTLSLRELYEDVKNSHYTESYRIDCIKACGRIGKSAWGILHSLHDLAKGESKLISDAAWAAIRKIDPGMPNFESNFSTSNSSTNKGTKTPTHTTTGGSSRGIHARGNGSGVHYGDSTSTSAPAKSEVRKVTITNLDVNDDLASGTRVYCTCNFCEKTTLLSKSVQLFNKTVVPSGQIYCTTCLRNCFYRPRINRNTLILTYRSLIGYYYHCFHLASKHPYMQIIDIQGYIDLHIKFGQQNPLFRYDPETYNWFVDFSKIGTGPKKLSVDYVLETVVQQIAAFGLYENIKEASPVSFYHKYREAIIDFLHHRRRPPGQKILCPTLYGCGIPHDTSLNKAIPNDTLKKFVAGHLIDSFKLKQNRGHYC